MSQAKAKCQEIEALDPMVEHPHSTKQSAVHNT